jgi:hypothetical protein
MILFHSLLSPEMPGIITHNMTQYQIPYQHQGMSVYRRVTYLALTLTLALNYKLSIVSGPLSVVKNIVLVRLIVIENI